MPAMKGKIAVVALLAAVAALVWVALAPHGRGVSAASSPPSAGPATVKVASLHPLLSEMAQRVGGDAVQVVNLFPPAADLHSFTPTGADIAAASGSHLLLACGKGVEPYLRDLRDSLPSVSILELGESIPDVLAPDARTPDPHWWSTPENMKRASLALAHALQQAAPAHAEQIAARQQAWARERESLTRRAKLELARIPAAQRVLVSEHAAMCHFCAAFHFEPIAVQGVAQESEGDTAQLAHLLADLRARRVPCIFTDVKDSPRFLENLAAQVGSAVRPLYMDGTPPAGSPMGYGEMFLHNVREIRAGLEKGADGTP